MGEASRKKGDWHFRCAARTPDGRRSRVLHIKVPRGKNDAYVMFEANDIKISLHDSGKSVDRPPWQIVLDGKHFDRAEPVRADGRRLVDAWGPIGALPPLMYCRLQVVMPSSEMAARTDWETRLDDVTWIEPISDGDAAFVMFLDAPSHADGPASFHAPPGLRLMARHSLPNERSLLVCGGTCTPIPELSTVLDQKRNEGQRAIFEDIAAGRQAALTPGPNSFDGYFPLGGQPCKTLVEVQILDYFDLGADPS